MAPTENLSGGEFVKLPPGGIMYTREYAAEVLQHRAGVSSADRNAPCILVLIDGFPVGCVEQIAPLDPRTWLIRRYMHDFTAGAGHPVIMEESVPKSRVKILWSSGLLEDSEKPPVDVFTGEEHHPGPEGSADSPSARTHELWHRGPLAVSQEDYDQRLKANRETMNTIKFSQWPVTPESTDDLYARLAQECRASEPFGQAVHLEVDGQEVSFDNYHHEDGAFVIRRVRPAEIDGQTVLAAVTDTVPEDRVQIVFRKTGSEIGAVIWSKPPAPTA